MRMVWRIVVVCCGWLVFSIGFLGPMVFIGPIGSASAQASEAINYVVQPGDTLTGIALRYGLTPRDLAAANLVLNPEQIFVGQHLIVPATVSAGAAITTTRRLHVVQADETLFGLAAQYRTTPAALRDSNQLPYPGFLIPGQILLVPPDARSNAVAVAQPHTPLPAPFTTIDIGPLPLAQGDTIEIIVHTAQPATLTGQFGEWFIPFAADGDRSVGLTGVSAHPVSGITPGLHQLVISATTDTGRTTAITAKLEIRPGHYNSEYIRLSADRQQLLDPELLAAEREKLNATWTVFTTTRHWNGQFQVPVEKFIRISSPFGTRRSYGGGPMTSYHEGTDFALPSGTPVYAPADGIVAVAEPLAVRGNAVVIDHGWGIYSGLYHLSEIKVTPGQQIKQGDLVALSGNTGLSTGAHLHWDIRIRGLNVDAMQLTQRLLP
jgi:murein DD-endopeptidase MepM/ murein hydrolase activator NlpD